MTVSDQTLLFARFGMALAIGLLIGLQREHAQDGERKTFAGVRTFALLGLAGCLAAHAAEAAESPYVFATLAGLLGLLIIAGYAFQAADQRIGGTSAVAAVITVLIGALCFWGEMALATALGVTVTVLLSLKPETHGLARRLSPDDIEAILKFGVITAIILPVLPNEDVGPAPFDLVNPYKVWLLVVLISGISFLGYVLIQIVGARRGIGMTGLLGGLSSSTAVTAGFSQRSREHADLARPLALGITLAWVMMFARVAIEVAAVNRGLLASVALPLAAAGGVALVWAVRLYRLDDAATEESLVLANPFELRPAVTFAALYVVVLIVARAAQLWLGTAGIFVSSVAAGVADVDAITLSMSELSARGSIEPRVAAQAIMLAVMSNTVVKGGIVVAAGSMALRRALLPGFVAILVAGLGVALVP